MIIMTVTNNDKEVSFFVHRDCGHCKDFKELNKEAIAQGKIKLLDVAVNEEANKLATKLNVQFVPTPLVKNMATGTEQVCQLSQNGKKVSCPDGTEVDL